MSEYVNIKTVSITISIVLVGVLIWFIFVKKTAPNDECSQDQVKSDLCEKNGCIKKCSSGTFYNCLKKDCEVCADGKSKCGDGCCESKNCVNNVCCPKDFQCPDPNDSTKSTCCAQGQMCVNGTCKTTCGKNLVCADNEECSTLYNLPVNIIGDIGKNVDKSKYEINGQNMYICQPRDGANFSNEKTVPVTLGTMQPCFNLQNDGFCTSDDPDPKKKQQCFSNIKPGDCGAGCTWWNLLDKAAALYGNTQLESIGIEYQNASGNSANGYYCDPQNGQGYSRVVVAKGGEKATYENCVSQLSNHSVRDIRWDNDNKMCVSLQDCKDPCQDFANPCTPNKDVLQNCSGMSCPATSGFQCQNGQLSPTPKQKTYKCSTKSGKCVEYGIDSQDDQSKVGKYSDGTCNNECPASFPPPLRHLDSGVGGSAVWQSGVDGSPVWCNQYSGYGYDSGARCHGGYGPGAKEAHQVCTNFAKNDVTNKENNLVMPGLNYTNYDWTCDPMFTPDGKVMENSDRHDPYCTCNGRLKNCQIFEDADRKLLNSSDPCFLK